MPSTNDARRDGLLTVDQACIQLSISKSLLRGELLKHKLPVVRIGRRLFIPPQTCDDLIRLGMRPSTHTGGGGDEENSRGHCAAPNPKSFGATASGF
jgi:hypothetical protein